MFLQKLISWVCSVFDRQLFMAALKDACCHATGEGTWSGALELCKTLSNSNWTIQIFCGFQGLFVFLSLVGKRWKLMGLRCRDVDLYMHDGWACKKGLRCKPE